MPSKAFKEIMAGLKDAQAYINGDKSRGRVVSGPVATTSARHAVVGDHIIVDVAKLRAELGLSQTEFATGFGVAVKTLQNWEQGRRVPPGPARTLLTVIRKNPELVLRTVWPQKARRPAGSEAR
jgi:putative transcriptional regulator